MSSLRANGAKRLLVTGATGFVGRRLTERALADGFAVTALMRPERSLPMHPRLRVVTVEDIAGTHAWDSALVGVDAVIHAAGRAHIMNEQATDPLEEFRRINARATRQLAEAASQKGVRRLVFVSSIKVNGQQTFGTPFRESDAARPSDPYSVSKWEAEQALASVAARTGLEVCVVRPPLVYGPGVRANFLSLLRWIDRGLPLPFALIANRRSMVGVSNLVDLLLTCVTHARARGELFFATDNCVAPSIGELSHLIAKALDRRANLLPVPRTALQVLGMLSGRGEQVRRLCDSLEVDGSKARQYLGWAPPSELADGLRETAAWYRAWKAT